MSKLQIQSKAVISDTIGSNPVMCKNYIEHSLTANCIKKMKIKREAVNGPIKNSCKSS